MQGKQWVCLSCGFNMIGEMPDVCPFCGATHDKFQNWEEATNNFHIKEIEVSNEVTQLIVAPALGYEHAAYHIKTSTGSVMIDCPAIYSETIKPAEAIMFTHHHFLGAANQYQALWQAKLYLHDLDAQTPLVQHFKIDNCFTQDFVEHGVAAYHIDGHTKGFTIYIYNDIVFVCDFAFPPGHNMQLNPYSHHKEKALAAAKRLLTLLETKTLTTVCGYNYFVDYDSWSDELRRIAS